MTFCCSVATSAFLQEVTMCQAHVTVHNLDSSQVLCPKLGAAPTLLKFNFTEK